VLRRVLTWGALSFLVFFVILRLSVAWQLCQAVGGGVWDAVTALGDIVTGTH